MKNADKNIGSYFRFSSFGLKGFADDSLIKIRKQVYETFMHAFSPREHDSLLDAGVSLDDHGASNLLIKKYPYKMSITAVGLEDGDAFKRSYPEIEYVRADSREMPFESSSFDYCYSHAVIEHVGVKQKQVRFIQELLRVSRKGVFFTTPDRMHPLEFHTGLPLIHYLPTALYLNIYKVLGKKFYANIENLNLLTVSDLKKMLMRDMKIPPERIRFYFCYFLGFKSNILVAIKK